MGLTVRHEGGCHCGAVRFSAELSLESATTCNCSICLKRGSALEFIPRARFELLKGAENLTEYKFNKHVIAHQFCKTCGILPFAYGQMPDGTPIAAVNVRCVDAVKLESIRMDAFDGKSY